MTQFNNCMYAINWLDDVLNLSTEGATWYYENSDCPAWDDEEFTSYDFLADAKVAAIPEEFVS